MSWIIRDEVLLITTAAAANAKATVRVHNVSDLLGFGETADRVASTLESVLGGQPPAKAKASGTDDPFGGPAPPAKTKAKDRIAEDPFGEREPARSDKPKNPFKDPEDPFE